MFNLVLRHWAVVVLLCAAAVAQAEEENSAKITVLAEGLDRPSAVCVQPSSADLFFFEAGSGRVLQQKAPFSGGGDFPPPRPVIQLSPQAGEVRAAALEFLDREHLLIAVDAEQPALQVWKLQGQEVVAMPLQSLTLRGKAQEAPRPRGVVATGKAAIVVQSGVPTGNHGAALQVELSGQKLDELKPLVPAEGALAHASSPVLGEPLAVTLSPRGELVVVHRRQDETTSRLTFFNSSTGKLLLDQALDLVQVSSLAYSPKTGRLYATVPLPAVEGGGIYRLDATLRDLKPAVQSIRLVELDRPTSIACWPNGTAFVTTHGPAADGDIDAKMGQLLSIEAGF